MIREQLCWGPWNKALVLGAKIVAFRNTNSHVWSGRRHSAASSSCLYAPPSSHHHALSDRSQES